MSTSFCSTPVNVSDCMGIRGFQAMGLEAPSKAYYPSHMLTPLEVKLGSQVCGGTPHAWLQKITLPRMGHAVGVRIVLRCGTHRLAYETANMPCMFVEQSAHLRRAPWWIHENTDIQACVEPSSPHTWLHNFTPNGVSHTFAPARRIPAQSTSSMRFSSQPSNCMMILCSRVPWRRACTRGASA